MSDVGSLMCDGLIMMIKFICNQLQTINTNRICEPAVEYMEASLLRICCFATQIPLLYSKPTISSLNQTFV